MAYPNELGSGRKRKHSPGHYYDHVGASDNARVHLGNTYHIAQGLDNPLRYLPYAEDAPFNSYAKQHEPTCLHDTRVDLLREIYDWADGQDERCILWLSGLAGTGKSTIARTVARNYYNKQPGRLAASFFFSRGGADVGHAGKFVTSIARQLALNVRVSRQHITNAVVQRDDIASQSLRDQWRHLVLDPLLKLGDGSCSASLILVVDALDECDSDENIRIIVELLSEARSLKKVRLRVLLTSRPEVPIRHGFYRVPEAEHQDVVLHNISPAVIDHDITLFLKHKFSYISQEKCLDGDWPGAEVISSLVRKASGLFIWAATAYLFIREGLVEERLRMLIEGGSYDNVPTPEAHLDSIYTTVLQASVPRTYSPQERQQHYKILRAVLGSIVTLFSPLSVGPLSSILSVLKRQVGLMLRDLHAILVVPSDSAQPLRLHHPSFRDFLLSEDRCSDANFLVKEKSAHEDLARKCLQLMSSSFKQDTCEVDVPGTLADKDKGPQLRYACHYWIQHLTQSGARLCDDDQVHSFLQEHCLRWLEALGWMKKVPEGIHAISSLESMTLMWDCPALYAFVHDMKRFALYSRSVIEHDPLQVYCSGLVFAPSGSILKKQFADKIPGWIKKLSQVDSSWSAVLQTLEGHTSGVHAVAFSPDSKVLASGSEDNTVKLWDVGTGAVLQTLRHSDQVVKLAFSPDGKILASVSDDRKVKVWEAGTGTLRWTLSGHLGWASEMAFSPDGKELALILQRTVIELWNVGTGERSVKVECSRDSARAVTFSPDDTALALVADYKEVRLLNVSNGEVLQVVESYREGPVAFSSDGKILASVSLSKTLTLWDASTGKVLRRLKSYLEGIMQLTFSPDSKVLVSASGESTVELWNTDTGELVQTFEGYSPSKSVLAFSPDNKTLGFASGKMPKTIKLWKASTDAVLHTLEDHSDYISAVAFSPDGKVLVSASSDRTIKLWEAGIDMALTHKDDLAEVRAIVFSPDGAVLASISGDMWSRDKTIKLWDVGTGLVLKTLETCSGTVSAVAFSPDGKVLASMIWVSMSSVEMITLWDVGTGLMLKTFETRSFAPTAVTFSPDGKMLASISGDMWSRDKLIKLWDVGAGLVLKILKTPSGAVEAVAFSPDGKILASALDETVELWEPNTEKELQMLEGHSDLVRAVAFSPDGKLLVSASQDKTIKLWEVEKGTVVYTLKDFSDIVSAVAFSPDGKLLASQLCDGTVKLWGADMGAAGAVLQPHSVDATLSMHLLSSDAASLCTYRGPTSTRFSFTTSSSWQTTSPKVSIEEQWIEWQGSRKVWLPSEYRAFCAAVYGEVVALGHNFGRVSLLATTP